MGSGPTIADSARKHGVTDEDILHAYRNPIRLFELDEGFTMIIGANRDRVRGGSRPGGITPVIVHAMWAREKFLR